MQRVCRNPQKEQNGKVRAELQKSTEWESALIGLVNVIILKLPKNSAS